MLNNRETFTIDLRDLYGKKLDTAAAKSEKQTAKISKGLTNVSTTAKGTKKNVDDLSKSINNLDRTKQIKIKVDDREVTAAGKKIKALENTSRIRSSGGGGGGLGIGSLLGFGIAGVATLAIAGAGIAIDKSIEATAKYEKLEAVLSNTLGSKGAAKNVMQQISDFASKTPFQVDELTAGFVKLANQGFTPTLRQMTSLGDLAASTGKSYDQLVEAILDAQTGEFERLKEFGIRASVQGNKVSFTFKGQTTVVDKSAEAMRNYVLSLGNAVGVSGAMEKISATTGGQLSNLGDNVDLLWKALGEKFNPEIKRSIGGLNKTVATIRSWVEIPLSEKLQDETNHLQKLRNELGFSNTSEQRRKEILEEVKQIQPDIIDGSKKEKEQLEGLTGALDNYIKKRREQIIQEKIKEKFSGTLLDFQQGKDLVNDSYNNQMMGVALASNLGYVPKDGLTPGQMQLDVQSFLKKKITSGQVTNARRSGVGKESFMTSDEAELLTQMQTDAANNRLGFDMMKKNKKGFDEYNRALNAANALFPNNGLADPKKVTPVITPNGSLDTAGINSVNGGSSVKNIYISIGNLVNGGVNVHTTTLKEGVSKAKDMIIEGLLTAVNDANLAGGNN